jgi:hypothetical protein
MVAVPAGHTAGQYPRYHVLQADARCGRLLDHVTAKTQRE